MFNKQIIFFDTEFSNLNPYKGEILSLGLVKENGEELYLELECDTNEYGEWVKENILPTLKAEKVSRKKAVQQIKDFVGKDEPIMMAFANQYDTIYLYKLFDGPETPFYWMPIDFASILFQLGYEPEDYLNRGKIFNELGINLSRYNQHNALDDAKLIKETYTTLKERGLIKKKL